MKTWAERIAEARARGGFTVEDWNTYQCWGTCLIGEATGVLALDRSDIGDQLVVAGYSRYAARELMRLGILGWGHPKTCPNDQVTPDFVANRLEEIRAFVLAERSPSDDSIVAATVAEALKHAAEPELCEV